MAEFEIIVSDFTSMTNILLAIGLIQKFYEEKRRIRYLLSDIEFDIDFYPKLAPYLEIESSSWSKINKAIKLLGLDPKDKKIFSTYQIYQLAGIEMLDFKEITFNRMVKRGKK